MLGRNILVASTALVASMALAACDNNGGGGVGPQEVSTVMSATHGSFVVETGAASIVVNSFDLDTGEFNVTLTLADGVTEVTMTEADVESFNDFDFGSSPEEGIRVKLDNGDDEVRLYIGLLPGADEEALITAEDGADILDASLFVIAAIDPDGIDGGFNSYIVTGDQTQPGAMPADGEATYEGMSRATLYRDGSVTHSRPIEGDATVVADFGAGTVDISLSGDHSGDSYNLSTPVPVTITGSLYEGIGALEGPISTDYVHDTDVATGDVIGAFYGDGAEATAGVFGAAGIDGAGHLNEIVGAFGAYEVEPEP